MDNTIEIEKEGSNHSVAVLSGTFFNLAIFVTLFIYQLCSIREFNTQVFGHPVHGALVLNIMFTLLYLFIVILLICNPTIEPGNVLAGVVYGVVIICGLFLTIFEPEVEQKYFAKDDAVIFLMAILCSLLGVGADLRWKTIKRGINNTFRKENFTVDNVKYYFQDSIFVDSRNTILKSIFIAVVLLIIVTVLITVHPISMLLK